MKAEIFLTFESTTEIFSLHSFSRINNKTKLKYYLETL